MMKPAPHRQGGTGDREGSSSTARVIEPTASDRQRTTRLADPVEVAWARAETRAYLIAVGEIDDPVSYFMELALDLSAQARRHVLDLPDAVDPLYECAFHSGLVDELGDDHIQHLLSQAFARPRRQRAAA